MVVTKEDKIDFEKSAKCWICHKPIEKNDKKGRDHDYHSGKYRRCAHNKRNTLFRKAKFLPVIFHTFAG